MRNKKLKYLILLLIITSLFGYLEWGGGNHSFLYEAEYLMLKKLFTDPKNLIHPFVIIPFLGQLILLVSLFQTHIRKFRLYFGIICLWVLLGFMLLIGLMSVNFKIIISTIPFIMFSIYTIYYLKRLP